LKPIKLAFLGVGDVAHRDYLPHLHRLGGRARLVAVCGRTEGRARATGESYGVPWYTDYTRMLAESDADAIVNLTPIQVHSATTLAALEAGKHVYSEKPVATTVRDAERIRSTARRHHLKLVCAPCVLIFPQVRIVQSLIREGAIGPIHAARGYGHGGVPPWHGFSSDPSPFFARGGGPAMDMAVYPLHALTGLLGPVQRVTAITARAQRHFVVPDGPAAGKKVPIEVDDNWQFVLDFGAARLASVSANNVVQATRAPELELYGLNGTIALSLLDVGAPVEVLRAGHDWEQIPVPFGGRASGPDHHLGVEHLVDCIQQDLEPVLSVDHALHVVEIIEAAALASEMGQTQELKTSF
jgi:predicted dehydrogenase